MKKIIFLILFYFSTFTLKVFPNDLNVLVQYHSYFEVLYGFSYQNMQMNLNNFKLIYFQYNFRNLNFYNFYEHYNEKDNIKIFPILRSRNKF